MMSPVMVINDTVFRSCTVVLNFFILSREEKKSFICCFSGSCYYLSHLKHN